ncbi:glycerophosphoryl diester phosphodiesterase membrane domain-containing protein [Streptomyces sp. NPDC002994]|uniref:glycerophosphoryl diester phosphodiesterase membrane domain-containing protein n=1 Tax=Streptomyces sp. NPDC002994 TaxID=3154441 RepID=UPI0033B1A9B1
MNDSPGWASPGSAPSDGQKPAVPRPAQPAEPADQSDPASKWSKEQPPAAQWSAPSGPGGHAGPPQQQPAPKWGGRPQGGGWGGPAPVAKPGVIPLRPLGIGEILDGAVSTLRAHWRTVLGITVTVAVITQICDILIQRHLLPAPPEVDPNATPSEALSQSFDAMQSTVINAAPTFAIALIGTLFTTALLTMVISRSVLGRPVTLADAWREAKPQLPQLLGLALLLPLLAAAIMTVGILPGLLLGGAAGIALALLLGTAAFVAVLWLMVRFSLASPALMLERQSIKKSLSRSAKLVSGAWWRVFGIMLLTMLLTFIVSMIIAVPFGLIAYAADDGLDGLFTGQTPEFGWPFLIITGIGAVIAASITYPINAGVTVLLYIDQRIRREALDLELARAAGIPGYGPQQPTDTTPGS